LITGVRRRIRLPADADLVGLYILLALALLAPLASNDILPSAIDHANHTALVVEARLALDEGQLPLRVAPFADGGLRYPIFQFYAHSPYLVAGILYKFVTPANPWLAIKLTYLIGLCLAAFFVHKLGQLLGFDRTSSALSGVVFIAAPYLLINIHARGAFTEAFAQCVLPAVAYASSRVVVRQRPWDIVWATLTWCILGTSHLITFLYGTIFFGLFVIGLVVWREANKRTAAMLLLPCLLGWSLAAFQWYPAATVNLRVHSMLGDVFSFRWLTPLSGLLSFTSLPPEPAGRPGMTTFLHPAIGAPILVAAAGLLYLRSLDRLPSRGIWICMTMFAGAFICAWSPVNFWSLLPTPLLVAQFSYRFLTFTTVFGTMLFAYFLWIYRQRYGPPSFVGWLIAVLLLAQSYLPAEQKNDRTLASIIAAPVTSVEAEAYEFDGAVSSALADTRFLELKEARQRCGLDGPVLKCTFNLDVPTAVQLPMLFYPSLLRITVNGRQVDYHASLDGTKAVATVLLEAGRHRVFGTFRGSPAANAVSVATVPLLGILWYWRFRRTRRTAVSRSLPSELASD
jgi:hypothetical protein